MRLSVELVPRDIEVLLKELNLLQEKFKNIDIVNIPDLLRFDMRSWEACSYSQKYVKSSIPHIRAIDINPKKDLPMLDTIIESGISEVLIIKGDLPQGMRQIYSSSSIDIIKKIKAKAPHIKVYGAIDPYRTSIKDELKYTREKIKAGADGFFTQPFFDMNLLRIYSDALEDTDVFWGVSPVLGERSQNYWETKNNVVFPKSFKPEMQWNVNFAKQVLDYLKEKDSNIYFMPIKINLEKYLKAIFE